jgi:hypothetical protein
MPPDDRAGRDEGRATSSSLPHPALLAATFAFAAFAWSLAGQLWSLGERGLASAVFALGVSLGPCLAGCLGAPRRHKPLLRRIVLVTGGLGILAPSLLGTLDVADLFRLLLAGVTGAAIGYAGRGTDGCDPVQACPPGIRPPAIDVAPRRGS